MVPLEYLESTENTATFAYNGKEYGFYMAKDGDHFDLLLIDFVYEFDDADHTNNEYKIRIKPILQTGFSRSSTEDGYVWEKPTLPIHTMSQIRGSFRSYKMKTRSTMVTQGIPKRRTAA